MGTESLRTPAGSFTARRVRLGTPGGRQEWWITDQVPGGWVKYRVSESDTEVNYVMELVAHGTGAKSELGVRLRMRRTLCASLLALALLSKSAVAQDAPRMQLVVLGTGTPNADPERSGPALAVVRGERSYLVDAGPGIVRRAAAASQRHDMAALQPSQLRVLFLTHLHSDHTIGLPDVILSAWTLERDVPLEVYGPPGTQAMVEHLLAAYSADIRNRIDGLEPANPNGWRVKVHEIVPGVVLDDGNVRVQAFAVPHGDWEVAFGYRFESAERSIVISGDTRASDAVAAACNGCDVLAHEVYSADRFVTRPPECNATTGMRTPPLSSSRQLPHARALGSSCCITNSFGERTMPAWCARCARRDTPARSTPRAT